MEHSETTSLIRILPACLTEALPPGWDAEMPGYVIEVMPTVDQPEAIIFSLPMTEPDVLLLDADYPGVDPFAITRSTIDARPGLAVVMLSRDDSPERLRQAMLAGAEEYLIKPLEAKALREGIVGIASHRTLRVVAGEEEFEEEQEGAGVIVGVVSGKGGLGKTTLAVNLAAVVAKTIGKSAGIIGLESGDAGVLLSLQPKLGLLDLAAQASEAVGGAAYTPDWLKQFGAQHKSGIGFWTWQGNATQGGGGIPDDFIPRLLEACRKMFSVTFIDFPLLSSDEAASVLGLLDIIVVVSSTSDLLALRSTKTFLEMVPQDLAQRVRIIINRADAGDIISRGDFEEVLDHKAAIVLPNQPNIVAQAINMGSPFVLTQPQSDIAVNLRTLAQTLFKLPVDVEAGKPKKRFMIF